MPKTHTFTPNWTSNNAPLHPYFDDIYFNQNHGAAESTYVFIEGNSLPQRFQDLSLEEIFNIAELGFGTGLNFFLTQKYWYDYAPKNAQLIFTSFEKFPLTKSAINTALAPYTDVLNQPFMNLFLEQYTPKEGWNSISIGNITLHLAIGDVQDMLPALNRPINAWFLDGFAPAKNPDMWAPEVFQNMGRLTASNGTFATFTAAKMVRNALADASFTVQRIKGFRYKRHMLKGERSNDA